MPSKERINEIEQGLEHQFIETIQNTIETKKLCFELAKYAQQEILTIFPTFVHRLVNKDFITVFVEYV